MLGFTDEERYWHAACTSTVAAGILIGSSYAGLMDVPLKPVIKALKALVVDARVAHVKSARSAEDVLNTFTREFYGRFIVVRKDAHNKLLAEMGTLQEKLDQAKTFLKNLKENSPEFFNQYSMNGDLNKKGNELLEDYYNIVHLADYQNVKTHIPNNTPKILG